MRKLLLVALLLCAPTPALAQSPMAVGNWCLDVSVSPNAWRPCTAASAPLPVVPGTNTSTDGSTTITLGGTAQNLFAGTTPTNGFTVINPDPSEDCWLSQSTTAAANATGSIRLPANGGGYETPPTSKPISAVSVVCATTGHKLTAWRW